eukprot:215231-Pelagomonas_calceolata.AAC.5
MKPVSWTLLHVWDAFWDAAVPQWVMLTCVVSFNSCCKHAYSCRGSALLNVFSLALEAKKCSRHLR